jgi:uncharacterized protein YbjQ (UPF0145 family)
MKFNLAKGVQMLKILMKYSILLVFISTLSNCAPFVSWMYHAERVRIYYDKPENIEYTEINIVAGQNEQADDALRALRIAAAKLGADAVIIQKNEDKTNQSNAQINQIITVNNNNTNGKELYFIGMAIKYKNKK